MILPVELSVKFTGSGVVPFVGLAVKLATGAEAVTEIVLVTEVLPPAPVTLRVAVWFPVSKVFTTFGAVSVVPSLNVQVRLVMLPVEPQLKVTSSGPVPESGLAVKLAVGAGSTTVMYLSLVVVWLPLEPVAVRLTV